MIAVFEFDSEIEAMNHRCHAFNGRMWDVATGTVELEVVDRFLVVTGRASTVRNLKTAAVTEVDVQRTLVEDA